MQPHRHHRSAAGLSCVPAAWTSLPAPVLPPETEETVDPAGRHRTGLARAGWHFWACSASYQPAPKSADPRTCTGRQCTHRDDQNSQDRPSCARRQPREAAAANAQNSARRDSPENETRVRLARADQSAPAPLCCPGRSPKPPDQADHRSGAARKPILRLQLVAGLSVSPPEIAPKTAVHLHPNHSHRAAPTPTTFSVAAFGRPQTLIRSALGRPKQHSPTYLPRTGPPPPHHRHCARGPAARAAHAPTAPRTCPCRRLRRLLRHQRAQLGPGVEPGQALWSACRLDRLTPIRLYLSPCPLAATNATCQRTQSRGCNISRPVEKQ